MFLGAQPWHVVIGQFRNCVESDEIVEIDVRALHSQTIHHSSQLLLILRVDFGPEHPVRDVAKKIPISSSVVGHFKAHRGESVCNFGREQVAVLVPDLERRTFQVHVNPSVALKAVSLALRLLNIRIMGRKFGRLFGSRPRNGAGRGANSTDKHRRYNHEPEKAPRRKLIELRKCTVAPDSFFSSMLHLHPSPWNFILRNYGLLPVADDMTSLSTTGTGSGPSSNTAS